jgi:dihydrofolate reductase
LKEHNKNISIIVAIASNYAIGKNNDLLWHIPNDLKRFKRLTENHYIVMGKRTYYSLPKRPLPKRTSLVITDIEGEEIDGCIMAYSIGEAIDKMDDQKENFIIGGGSIYKQFMPLACKLYITRVHKDFEADTFFPEISLKDWELVSIEDVDDDDKNEFNYSFEEYVRKTK